MHCFICALTPMKLGIPFTFGSYSKSLGLGAVEKWDIFLSPYVSKVTDAVQGEQLCFLELISSENTSVESLHGALPEVLCGSCHASIKLLETKTLFQVKHFSK